MQTLHFLFLIFTLIIQSCANNPYPYHDSALNDHNRAPASLGVPDDTVKTDQKEKIEKQTNADFFFLKSDLEASEGNHATSIELLKSAIQVDHTSTTLKQKLAIEYYRKGQLNDAIYWVQKALDQQPHDKELMMLYGSMLMAKKEFDKAEQVYSKLNKSHPKDADSYLYLGALYAEKNETAKAIKAFTKVISIGTYEPKYLPFYYRARTIVDSQKKSQYSQARKDLEKCFELKPDYLEAIQVYSNLVEKTEGKNAIFSFYIQHQKKYGPITRLAEVLSQYYIEKDLYDKAYEQLEILEDSAEDNIQVKLKMALILIDKKSFEKAAMKLEELNTVVPESDKVKFYLSAVYEELKKFDKAIASYLEIQPSSHHYEDARVRASLLLKNKGDFKNAMKTANDALNFKKDNLQIYLLVAQLEDEAKNYDKSIEVLKKAEIQFPKNSQVNYFIGTVYDRLNKKSEMLKYMKLSIEYDNKNFQAMNYVAYSLSELGQQLELAEEYALKAYQLQKDDPFIIDTLGWVYYKKGEYSKALPYLEKAHDISPDVGVIAEHLGDTYLKLKKDDKARSAYLRARKEEKDTDRIKNLDNKITSLEETLNLRSPANTGYNTFP